MNRKNIIWLILAIMIMVICLSLATYAYYTAKNFYLGSFDVDVSTKGVDIFAFNSSQEIVFGANHDNFSPENGHDVFGEANIDVELSTTKKDTKYCYEVNFQMPDEQVFRYTVYGRPELVLDIYKKEDDNEYEKVIDNFDITTQTGTLQIPTEKAGNEYKNEIYTLKNVDKIVSWKAVVTYKYFSDVNQSINNNKIYKSALKVKVVDC